MKKLFSLFVMLALSLSIAHGQTVYWLLFTDTKDVSVGVPSRNSYNFFRNMFRDNVNTVLRQYGYAVKEIDVKDDQLSPDRCRQEIKNLRCSSDDIIIYYSISHGAYNQQNDPNNPWTYMAMGGDDANNMVDLKWVHEQLKAKNPKFLLTVGMCCNSDFSGRLNARYAIANLPYYGPVGLSDDGVEIIRKMFLDKRGDILVTSSSPHHTSGCCEFNNTAMDLFTCIFSLVFNESLDDPLIETLTWEEFLETVKTDVGQYSRQLNSQPVHYQDPIYKINWGGSAAPVRQSPPQPPAQSAGQDNIASLEQILASIANAANPFGDRQKWKNSVKAVFASDAVVKKVSKDGSKVLDYVDLPDFLDDIASSRIILNIVVDSYKLNSANKISEIRVKEVVRINNKLEVR